MPGEEELNKGNIIENDNGASTPDDLDAIKASLEEEKALRAAVELAMDEKDARIAQLEAEITLVTETLNGKTAEMEEAATKLSNVSSVLGDAVTKYLEVTRTSNPTVPADIITGDTIEEIDQSLAKGIGIVATVRETIETEAAAGIVPAGAPVRGEVGLEGMTAREKISAGIKPKGGS